MRFAAALTGEIRHGLRSWVPARLLRILLLGLAGLLAAGLILAAAAVPGPRLAAMAAAPSQLAGVAVAALILAFAAGTGACVAIIRGGDSVRIAVAAPLPAWMVILLALARPLFVSLVPLGLLTLPVLVLSARISIITTLLILLGTMVIAVAANTMTVVLAAVVLRRKGPDAAVQILKVTAGVSAFMAIVSFQQVARWSLEPDLLVYALLASAVVLPLLWQQAAADLLDTLPSTNLQRCSPAPHWGRPGWLRLFYRTAAFVTVVGVIPGLLVLSRPDFEWRLVLLALLAVAFSHGPLTHVTRVLDEVQERWGPGPAAARVRVGLVVRFGLVAAMLGLLLPIALGEGSWPWRLAVAGVAALSAGSFLIPVARVREPAKHAVLVLAILTSVIP